ncbi:MAG: UbiA family prenyltransferase [Planctomycetota bacterium]
MSTRGRLRAWLEIMRISNLPTVLSNAIAGATLGACALAIERAPTDGLAVWFGGFLIPVGPDGPELAWLSASGTALFLAPFAIPLLAYLGGMVLNDAFDAEIDARERHSRPIPSGQIARRSAFAAGFALLGAALALAALRGPASVVAATAVLVLAIVVYDRFHAKTVASTLLLALCRALAALVPMLAFADGDLGLLVRRGAIALPIALAAWTLGLSLLARNEIALRDAEASRADAAAQPCPKCGHLMVEKGHESCPECGERSTDIVRRSLARTRADLRAGYRNIVPIAAAVVLLAAFFTTHVALLHRGRAPGSTLAAGNPGAAIIVAILLALAAVRAAQILRREPARTPDAIGMMIACLALVDAMALATGGHWLAALACTTLFLDTRLLQRRIAGS